MRSLKLAVGLGLMAAAAAAWGYTPGAGLASSAHDFSSAYNPATNTGGTKLLNWQYTDSKGVLQVTTYNCMGLNASCAPNLDATGKQTTTIVQIGLCTKCHTPHKAKSTALLWNHTLQATQYAWDEPTTTAGTKYATFRGDTYRGPTTKCLSCHDGLMSSTDGMWFNRQSTSGSKYVAAPGSLDSGHDVTGGGAGGSSMTGNHPVAMPYPFGGAVSHYNGVDTASFALNSGWVADPTTVGVMLYNDDGTGAITRGAVANKSGMECGSCHDVHNGSRVPATSAMLVTGNIVGSDGTYICNKCHSK